jgi:hypothetical protein
MDKKPSLLRALKGATLRRAPSSLANIKLGSRGLPWTKNLAYYEH